MSTSYISMLKGKTVRFNTVGDLNEEFKDAMLADMLRYGTFPRVPRYCHGLIWHVQQRRRSSRTFST